MVPDRRVLLLVIAALITVSAAAAAIPKPMWIEPTLGVESAYDFQLQVADIANLTATDMQIFDAQTDELVWNATLVGQSPHFYNLDGVFLGSLANASNLVPGHPYTVRARYHTPEGTGPWNGTSFTTEPNMAYSDSPLNWTPPRGFVVQKFATGLSLPVELRPAPPIYAGADSPYLYVGELYGRIDVVTRSGAVHTFASGLLNYPPTHAFPGSGEMGVTGLWVDTDGTVWATMTYVDNGTTYGKLMRFDPSPDGMTAVNESTVFDKIPVAPSHQVQMVTRGPDGKLYINTGDANLVNQTKDWGTLNGKILRIDDNGSIPADNPVPGSPVWVAGLRNPFGADWYNGSLWISQNGPDKNDGIYKVHAGETLGWYPDMTQGAWYDWYHTVCPTQIQFDRNITAFHPGALYAVLSGDTYTKGPSDDSKRIVRFITDSNNITHEQDFVTYTGRGYSGPIGVAFAGDSMYFTDIYGEAGINATGGSNGTVYRVRYVGNVTMNGTLDFHMNQWFPQGLAVSLSCAVVNGSSLYRYDYDFGNGYTESIYKNDFVYHVYNASGTYRTSCTATDLLTGAVKTVYLNVTVSNGTSTGGSGSGNSTNSTGGSGNSTNATGNATGPFNVSLAMGQWFPQGLAVSLECHSNRSSATYTYDFGNGYVETIDTSSFVYHIYNASGTYHAHCTVASGNVSETRNLTVTVSDGTSTGGGSGGSGGGSGSGSGNSTNSSGGSGNSTNSTGNQTNATNPGALNVSLTMGQWFPQGLAVSLWCSSNSTDASYTYDFGNGYVETIQKNSFVYYVYPTAGSYLGSCTVTDLATNTTQSANLSYSVS